MKKIILLCSIILCFIISCTFDKGEVPAPIQSCVTDSTIYTVPVSIDDDFFNPSSITILVGDTVKWTYVTSGVSVHTATCDGTNGTSLPSGGTTWDSGVLNPGGIYKKAITVPGNYSYVCMVHGISMSGKIIVKPRCQ